MDILCVSLGAEITHFIFIVLWLYLVILDGVMVLYYPILWPTSQSDEGYYEFGFMSSLPYPFGKGC